MDRKPRTADPDQPVVVRIVEWTGRKVRPDMRGQSALAALTEAVTTNRTPAAVPSWLHVAAGDPESYDVPDPARVSVKVRVLPTLYARLEQARARFGLQTLTGTWECLLRLGLAAAERMPVRGS